MDENLKNTVENVRAMAGAARGTLDAMHDAMDRARAVFLRDSTERIKACSETLELCVDELNQSGLSLSRRGVLKTWRAAEKHLYQLIADLEAACAELPE